MKIFVRAISLVILVSMALCALSSCKNECEHTYGAWSYDENGHWRAATCEHTDLKKNEGPHIFESNGECFCGYKKTGLPTVSLTTYTVTVINAAGFAVGGVEIKFVLPDRYTLPEKTDSTGKVTADLAEGVECCAMIVSVPDGYVFDANTRYEFVDNSVTITLAAK